MRLMTLAWIDMQVSYRIWEKPTDDVTRPLTPLVLEHALLIVGNSHWTQTENLMENVSGNLFRILNAK